MMPTQATHPEEGGSGQSSPFPEGDRRVRQRRHPAELPGPPHPSAARLLPRSLTHGSVQDWTQLYRRCNDVLLQNIKVFGSQLWGNNE